MAVLGYLPKLERGMGPAFGAHFLHDFCINFPYLVLCVWTKFQCHNFFPYEDTKENALLSSYLDN